MDIIIILYYIIILLRAVKFCELTSKWVNEYLWLAVGLCKSTNARSDGSPLAALNAMT